MLRAPARHAALTEALCASAFVAGKAAQAKLGREHTTTVWDHLQRNVQEQLQAADKDSWKKHPAWLALKKLSSTSTYRAATQSTGMRPRKGFLSAVPGGEVPAPVLFLHIMYDALNVWG